jgi:hypothetical protein
MDFFYVEHEMLVYQQEKNFMVNIDLNLKKNDVEVF